MFVFLREGGGRGGVVCFGDLVYVYLAFVCAGTEQRQVAFLLGENMVKFVGVFLTLLFWPLSLIKFVVRVHM